jgi:Glycosyl hydrolase catalytic core
LNNFPGVDFLPMLWGEKQIDQFYQWVKPGYARYMLAFNECVFYFIYPVKRRC